MNRESEADVVWKKAQVLQDAIVDDCTRMELSANDAAYVLVDLLATMIAQKLIHPRARIVLLLDARIADRERQIAKTR